MKDILISLCMICKDDRNFIEESIKSVKDIVDEIIIANIENKEEVKKLSKHYDIVIMNNKFEGNYSKLRNEMIKKANGKWILILDSDEFIDNENKEKILKYIDCNDYNKGIYVRVKSIINNKIRGVDNFIRLFRNYNNIKFNGKIQETVNKSIIESYGEDYIAFSDIEIKSYGNDNKYIDLEKKNKRYIQILNSYDESEKDFIYFYNLANEYGKRFEFDKALNNYNKSLKLINKIENEDIYIRLMLNKIKALYQLNMYDEAEENIDKFKKEYSDFRDVYFINCLIKIQKYKFDLAKESLDKYISIPLNIKYPSSEFEEIVDINELKNKLNNINLILEN